MKKIILGIILASSAFSFAYAAPCAILSANVTRGTESDNVLLLQAFLVGKGYLKATPNGYFGPATFAAVKVYQKSVGLPQTGAVLTLTRAALKKEVCFLEGAQPTGTQPNQTQSQTQGQPAVSTSQNITATIPVARPVITSVDRVTLFEGGTTDWGITIEGTGFSSSTNIISFKHEAGKVYAIGTIASQDATHLTLPINITKQMYSCGFSCKETLPLGSYEVTVKHAGGESGSALLTVKRFNLSATTGSMSTPVSRKVTGARLGSLSIGSSSAFKISSIKPMLTPEGFGAGQISGLILKDELTGEVVPDTTPDIHVAENQSKIIGVYGNINTEESGTINGYFVVDIVDYIGNKHTVFTSPTFLTSVSGL